METLNPHIIAGKNLNTKEKSLEIKVTEENFLEILETIGVVCEFSVKKDGKTDLRTVIFKLEEERDKEILVNIYDGSTKIGYLSFDYSIYPFPFGKYYKPEKLKQVYGNFQIMTLGTSILFEVAKSMGVKKITGFIRKDSPDYQASVNSRKNIKGLFNATLYMTEEVDHPNSTELITYL